jgi:hypothetical protein
MNLVCRFFGAILAVGLAFSIAQAQEKKIKREQLPPAVEKTVAKESVGATIKGFATEVEHRQRFYEASLIVNGQRKDILMDKNGRVVEVEEEVSMDSLPSTVQDALKRAAGSGTMELVESLTKNGKLVAYEGHVKRGKKRFEIQVGQTARGSSGQNKCRMRILRVIITGEMPVPQSRKGQTEC